MIDGLDAHNAIVGIKSFEAWAGSPQELLLSKETGLLVKMVQFNDSSDEWRGTSTYRYYGEGPQGWTGESFLVFRVATETDTEYFKKFGSCDSYGETAWDGKFIRVTPKESTVTVYE